jgi:hypothetical protein
VLNVEMAYRAFGLNIVSALVLPGMEDVPAQESDPVRLELVDSAEVQAAWSGGSTRPVWETVLDDLPFRFEAGSAGDHLFSYGDEATFHLNRAADELLCAPVDRAAPDWQRVLLDTVLYTVSLLHGFEALHASAVELAEGPVALVSAMGGGKTSAAVALLRRGYPLFCDDILTLKRTAGAPLAYPGPALMNLPLAVELDGLPVGWRRLARFGDESWVAVAGAATQPRPVAAIVLLERRADAALEAQTVPHNALPLVPHALGLQHRPDRMRGTFEILCDLAESVPLYRLTAGPDASPDDIADVVEGVTPA